MGVFIACQERAAASPSDFVRGCDSDHAGVCIISVPPIEWCADSGIHGQRISHLAVPSSGVFACAVWPRPGWVVGVVVAACGPLVVVAAVVCVSVVGWLLAPSRLAVR